MNIRDLEYIIAVDELKSFIKASKKCFVSQPALSMQIQKAEDVLGVKIFERTRKSIITTPEGQKLINFAKEILRNFDSIKNIKKEATQIKIGLIHTIAPYLLPKIILSLQNELKDVKLFFIEGKTKELIESLTKGEIDAIILAAHPDFINKKYNNLSYNQLYLEPFFLCVAKNKFSFKNNSLNEKEFEKILEMEKLILLEEGNCMTDDLNKICAIYKHSNKTKGLQSDFYATSIETIKHMARLGNGVSILPELSISNEDKDLSYFKLPNEDSRQIGVLFRKNTLKGDVIGKISNLIKSEINA